MRGLRRQGQLDTVLKASAGAIAHIESMFAHVPIYSLGSVAAGTNGRHLQDAASTPKTLHNHGVENDLAVNAETPDGVT